MMVDLFWCRPCRRWWPAELSVCPACKVSWTQRQPTAFSPDAAAFELSERHSERWHQARLRLMRARQMSCECGAKLRRRGLQNASLTDLAAEEDLEADLKLGDDVVARGMPQ